MLARERNVIEIMSATSAAPISCGGDFAAPVQIPAVYGAGREVRAVVTERRFRAVSRTHIKSNYADVCAWTRGHGPTKENNKAGAVVVNRG